MLQGSMAETPRLTRSAWLACVHSRNSLCYAIQRMRLTDIIETGGQDWYRYGEAPPLCPLLAGCAEICEDALAVETAGVLGSVVECSRRVASFWIVQRLLYVVCFSVALCVFFFSFRLALCFVLSA